MKKHFQLGLALTLGLALAPMPTPADHPRSLRGDADISAPSLGTQRMHLVNNKDNVPRSFEQQPPLIPHKVDKYVINLKKNDCLDCHSKEKAKKEETTAISESHYVTRDGEKLKTLAPRRYLCTQCHVPQFDVKPLVANTFKPSKTAKSK